MAEQADNTVFVQVVDLSAGREIGWGTNAAELLRERISDVRHALVTGADSVAGALSALPTAELWHLKEVTASFGVTLTAEAGVILSKTSAEAAFEVSITYERAQ